MSLEGLNNRFSFFDSLTADVKIEILDYLDDLDLKVVSIASKHFNEISLEAFKLKHRGLLQAYFKRIPFFYPIEEFTLRCHNLAEVNHSFHRLAEGFIQSQLKKSQTELEQMEASTLLMQPPLFFRKVFEGIYKIKEFLALKTGLEQEKKVGMIKEILLWLSKSFHIAANRFVVTSETPRHETDSAFSRNGFDVHICTDRQQISSCRLLKNTLGNVINDASLGQ